MDQERDLITGQALPGCDDDYVRQALERLLLGLGYGPDAVEVDHAVDVELDDRRLRVVADLLLKDQGRPAMVIRCARGSLVSRENETLAAARLLAGTWLPLAVVSNGQDAELLDVATGRVLASGLEAIPGPAELGRLVAERPPHRPTPAQRRQAARVHHAYAFIQCPGKCTV